MTQIKICGITNRTDALTAAACGADALGFIFYEASPRHVTPDLVRAICRDIPDGIVRIGVFVNADASKVIEIVDFCGLDMIQLHGDEPPDYCRRFPAERLIKAVSFQGDGDPATLADYAVRAILLDHRDAGRYGGTGKQSDWNLAGRIKALYPLILAGGLHEGNIEEAIRTVAPDAVDLNSGVEQSPGTKDPEKVKRIIEIIRKIDSLHPSSNRSSLIFLS
ncbi:MAG: phosphoribosylanthranilate isomerase [Deltaproteobacteria bacterium HGW-Deltaproteobacteria-11]|nr:MAG: phosphoribosylanthranilate isomerase [Deltaproteobacteria bacterium HGW-Deltaproteobacteria-11]